MKRPKGDMTDMLIMVNSLYQMLIGKFGYIWMNLNNLDIQYEDWLKMLRLY